MRHRQPVAIIGGGWAGCAAAVELAAHGIPVTVYETAPVLGGRARRVERDGLPIDNGQHLLLGAYTATLAMLARVHDEADARSTLLRLPLAIVPFGPRQRDALTLRARRGPGRLGLLVGLLCARALSVRERVANIAWFRELERSGFARPPQETVAGMLAPLPPRVAHLLWEPLCIAALNTPATAASAQVFANVLRAAFAGAGGASDFLLPATDLSTLFPEAAARHLARHGGHVRIDARAQIVAADSGGVTLAVSDRAERAAAVVVAVGPHQLRQAFAREALSAHPPLAAAIDVLDTLDYEAIVTVWLGYATRVQLPAPIARLDDAPGQWLIDRPDVLARGDRRRLPPLAQLVSVTISAGGPQTTVPQAELVQAVDAQLRRAAPALPRCAWSQVIAERRATYACTPRRATPAGPRLAPGVYVAGDYVDTVYPATLEAAVRSGVAAAAAVCADLR
ncbi:MAG: FAD-dependent oxidoreductase [Burkholderiales bacterium]|nr:FAD-dependent oxidoreductase [Burkholderiales bacterium]